MQWRDCSYRSDKIDSDSTNLHRSGNPCDYVEPDHELPEAVRYYGMDHHADSADYSGAFWNLRSDIVQISDACMDHNWQNWDRSRIATSAANWTICEQDSSAIWLLHVLIEVRMGCFRWTIQRRRPSVLFYFRWTIVVFLQKKMTHPYRTN